MRIISIVVLIVVLLAGIGLFLFVGRDASETTVASFDECVAAGNPVMESYPRQCRDQNGTLYTEELPQTPGTPDMEPPAGEPVLPGTAEESNDVEVSGTITDINLEQMAIDGPARITISETGGSEVLITVPSMGLPLCEASANIADVATLTVGQTIEARGATNEAGDITPCESADHYLRLP